MQLKDGYSRDTGLSGEYRPLTRDEILALRIGQRIPFLSNDGNVRLLKVNGRIKTWKRDASRIEIPVKYGFKECATLTESNVDRLLVKIRDPITLEDLRAGESAASGEVQ